MVEITNQLKPLQSNLQNIFNLGKVRYVTAAPEQPWTIEHRVLFCASVLLDCCKFLFFCIPHVLMAIVFLVIPKPKKTVRGQMALVTGGGNGIGKEIALRLGREGCNVAVADIDFEAAQITAKELRLMGVQAHAYKVDVAILEQVAQLKADITRDMGEGPDILINNAGIMSLISMREGSNEELDRIIKINLNSHFYTVRAFLPGMIDRRRGHIVGMSSMSGLHPTPQSILYTSTKFGLHGLYAALQEELRQEGLGDCLHITVAFPYFVSTRQDIMDSVNLRYPPVTPTRTANETVDGMLRNEQCVTVPAFLFYLTHVMRSMPYKCQELARDYVLHEQKSKLATYNGGQVIE